MPFRIGSTYTFQLPGRRPISNIVFNKNSPAKILLHVGMSALISEQKLVKVKTQELILCLAGMTSLRSSQRRVGVKVVAFFIP